MPDALSAQAFSVVLPAAFAKFTAPADTAAMMMPSVNVPKRLKAMMEPLLDLLST
ncbi:unannotated protein [freshwater metagenome]|uniref:Unannotated protein n=1 Tax=freshwater metagenome TaxID=449393 RepID=A0A6J7SRW8_9ZZZZ